ncbi:MAG: 1,4-alpha-glucan branching protein GlgB [Tissierellia bacterium]|nr:1,4-alpha-glucan branching protein GlgB [Tissierellia bacterium]
MQEVKIKYVDNLDHDAYLFHEGTNYMAYKFLGAHPYKTRGFNGARFALWAPRAKEIYLIGDFNDWNEENIPMKRIENTGIWSVCVDGVKEFDAYKYKIITEHGEVRYKADPFAFHAEERPMSASKFYDINGYKWKDKKYLKSLQEKDMYNSPMNIYEANILSWRKNEDGSQYSYRKFADEIVPYLKSMGYTHLELMPIMEHPYDGSWGYQITGYFAPTSRFGTPKDFMYLVDKLHQNNIGIILDWVPVHFCKDDHGLARFDGTYLYESIDKQKAENYSWGTLNFDYSKPEVISFLMSNAVYWHEMYHIDGLRVDAVSFMIYDGYGKPGVEISENEDGLRFIKTLNAQMAKQYPNSLMIAEEATAYPKVTAKVQDDGLGFNFKWNMGWMNDILEYFESDPINRKYLHDQLRFSMTYMFSEKYILPLSHDEVVHGKKSLLDKMPGDYENKFANLRLLLSYMIAHPGKKILFMGGEFGQFIEWNEWKELDWLLLDYDMHKKLKDYVSELNKFYTDSSEFWELDNSFDGFQWVEHENANESILVFQRINKDEEKITCIFNFTPVERLNYPIGVDEEGRYRTLFSSDRLRYGGETKRVKTYYTKDEAFHGRKHGLRVDIPPLSALFLKKSK